MMKTRVIFALMHVVAALVGFTLALHSQGQVFAGTENIRFMGATFFRISPFTATDQYMCFGYLSWHPPGNPIAADIFADVGPGDVGDVCYGPGSTAAWFDLRGRSTASGWGSYHMWAHLYDGASMSTNCNDAKAEIWWFTGGTWVLLGYEHYLHVNAASHLPQAGAWIDYQVWIGDGTWINSWYQIGVTSNDSSVCLWEGYHVHQTYVDNHAELNVSNGNLSTDGDGKEYDQDSIFNYVHQWTGWGD